MTELTKLEDLLAAVKAPYAVVDFFGTWCPPCKAIAPHFETLATKFPHVVFVKVNVDNPVFEEAIKVCKISTLPTFFFYKSGSYFDQVSGANLKLIESTLTAMLKK